MRPNRNARCPDGCDPHDMYENFYSPTPAQAQEWERKSYELMQSESTFDEHLGYPEAIELTEEGIKRTELIRKEREFLDNWRKTQAA